MKVLIHKDQPSLPHPNYETAASVPAKEIESLLSTDIRVGLTSSEAERRLKKYGYNAIPEKKKHLILKILSYFWGPIPWMIELALLLSFLVGDMVDFWIILLLLLINAVVEFWQEWKAENVIGYLKKQMAVKSRVLRDGRWKVIDARLLVPGDVIKLRPGDIVPADSRIVEGELEVDESVLTGESLPVPKQEGAIVYSGSTVRRGDAIAVVIGTGTSTYFGKSVQLVNETEVQSELQKAVIRMGNYLMFLALLVIGIMIIVETLIRGKDVLSVLKFSLVLAVASIPAALPAVLSITMVVGALELARRNAIVTKLVSIEELASVDVLCTDKTGTITLNRIEVGDVYPIGGFSKEEVLIYASLASREEDKDPIDDAILSRVKKPKVTVLYYRPFSPELKRTEAEVIWKGKKIRVTKGAPQVILAISRNKEDVEEDMRNVVDEFAEKGFRSIAVAVDFGEGYKLIGVIGLYDPPRPDAAQAVASIKKMGVTVKMITGDHSSVARFIGKLVGIGEKVLSAAKLRKMHRHDMVKAVNEFDIFSEVLPDDKYRIVGLLQETGHLVAMTGDGINDVPALKKSNCGIAVAGATGAAIQAASIVLLEPGISVISDAFRTARRIFRRMESYVIYRLTETIRILLFLATSILLFDFYPINSTMVILLALLNDLPILTIAFDNVSESQRPLRWQPKRLVMLATILGVIGLISSALLLYIAFEVLHLPMEAIQTLIFLKLVVAGHFTLLISRSRGYVWERPYPDRRLLAAVLITDMIGSILAAMGVFVQPIGWLLVAFVWIYAALWVLINDLVKVKVLRSFGMDR